MYFIHGPPVFSILGGGVTANEDCAAVAAALKEYKEGLQITKGEKGKVERVQGGVTNYKGRNKKRKKACREKKGKGQGLQRQGLQVQTFGSEPDFWGEPSVLRVGIMGCSPQRERHVREATAVEHRPARQTRVVFGARRGISGPRPSCSGPQAALKRSYRSDSVGYGSPRR